MIASVSCEIHISSIQDIDSHPISPEGVNQAQKEEDQATMAVGIPRKTCSTNEQGMGSQLINRALLKTHSMPHKSCVDAKPSISVTTSPKSVIIRKRPRSGRRVHFAPTKSPERLLLSETESSLDKDDRSSPQTAVFADVKIDYNRLELTAEERNQMWWQATDYFNFKKNAKQITTNYRRLGPLNESESDYAAKFHNAIDLCANSSCHMKDCVPLLSNTSARGLEAHIFPQYHSERRRKVIRSVLKAQSKLPTTIDEDGRARLLNATSKHLTRPMRRFARLLAIGDAIVSADLDTNDKDLMKPEELGI